MKPSELGVLVGILTTAVVTMAQAGDMMDPRGTINVFFYALAARDSATVISVLRLYLQQSAQR